MYDTFPSRAISYKLSRSPCLDVAVYEDMLASWEPRIIEELHTSYSNTKCSLVICDNCI